VQLLSTQLLFGWLGVLRKKRVGGRVHPTVPAAKLGGFFGYGNERYADMGFRSWWRTCTAVVQTRACTCAHTAAAFTSAPRLRVGICCREVEWLFVKQGAALLPRARQHLLLSNLLTLCCTPWWKAKRQKSTKKAQTHPCALGRLKPDMGNLCSEFTSHSNHRCPRGHGLQRFVQLPRFGNTNV